MADDRHLRQRVDELEAELATLRTAEGVPYRTVVEDMSELVMRCKPDGTRRSRGDHEEGRPGLGRATVRTIVEGHDGRVSVRSPPAGTHIELAFPLAAEYE